jgi:SpoIID/LytB domain protein
MRPGDRAWVVTAVLAWLAAATAWTGAARTAQPRPVAGPAVLMVSLVPAAVEAEARADLLDTPVLPGSVIKAWALVAALESGVIEPTTARMCRRVVTVEGRRYVCAHPDLRRPLTPAEALAHSCNDYFVSLAPRLPRALLDSIRLASGLPALGQATFAAGLVGLDGPRIAPRALLTAFARLTGAEHGRRVPMRAATEAVLIDGLRGAVRYGSASALVELEGGALAKTGTAPMPGGGTMGLVVAVAPAAAPVRAVVVAAPGAAGRDAAALAADLLARPSASRAAAPPPRPVVSVPAPADLPAVDAEALRVASAGTTIRLGVSARGGVRVDTLPIEDYVARVLAGEGQPRAAAAAQQALAVAARTYALANLNRHRAEGFDLCDTTHCQVVRPSTPVTRRAALESAGHTLLAAGAPASVFYSALCGGRPERASEVWPGAVDYSEPPPEDDACREEPPWSHEITAAQLERALRAAGRRGSRLRELRIVQQNATGRVTRLRAEGFTPAEISGQDFRMAVGRVLGWQHVRSTQFDLRRTAAGYRFTGRGYGHGVGLCVIGAGHRAARGESVDEILRFYYPGLDVGRIDDGPAPAAAAAPPTLAAPPAPGGDVRVALPSGAEHERAPIVARGA